MIVINGELNIGENVLKNILTHVALSAECHMGAGDSINTLDVIKLFKEELESQLWLNDYEGHKYHTISLNISNKQQV